VKAALRDRRLEGATPYECALGGGLLANIQTCERRMGFPLWLRSAHKQLSQLDELVLRASNKKPDFKAGLLHFSLAANYFAGVIFAT
jgi:hypothetical protein